jgi:PleD family two-component response regulator
MEPERIATSSTIGVLVADSNQMQCQLLVGALRRRPEFRVSSCGVDMNVILSAIADFPVDVILMNADHPKLAGQDMANVRRLHLAHPHIAKVLVLGQSDHDSVVNAFRSGVKGLFCFADYPFRLLCKCIQSVHQGQVWANSEQLQYLLETLTQVPFSANGERSWNQAAHASGGASRGSGSGWTQQSGSRPGTRT